MLLLNCATESDDVVMAKKGAPQVPKSSSNQQYGHTDDKFEKESAYEKDELAFPVSIE